jgi:hypothetical protein
MISSYLPRNPCQIKKRIELILVAYLLLGISACAGVGVGDYQSVQSGVSRSYDNFKKYERYDGPKLTQTNLLNTEYVWLRAARDRDGYEIYGIMIWFKYPGDDWQFYDQIVDSEGNYLNTSKSDSDVSCDVRNTLFPCIYDEIIFAAVDASYLSDKFETGLKLRAYGDGYNRDITIPAYYIAAVLDAIPWAPKSLAGSRLQAPKDSAQSRQQEASSEQKAAQLYRSDLSVKQSQSADELPEESAGSVIGPENSKASVVAPRDPLAEQPSQVSVESQKDKKSEGAVSTAGLAKTAKTEHLVGALIRQGCNFHAIEVSENGAESWRLRCPKTGFVEIQISP